MKNWTTDPKGAIPSPPPELADVQYFLYLEEELRVARQEREEWRQVALKNQAEADGLYLRLKQLEEAK